MKENGSLPPLNLPSVELKTVMDGGILKVYDPLRKKNVALTPEEYVRQHFTSYLTKSLHYPSSIMANEISIELNGTRKRCDTVVFSSEGEPLMIVEYKAPSVKITQDVFDQIVRYNMCLKAKYLVVSNGMNHFCCIMDYGHETYQFLPRIPDYNDIRNPFSSN